jgi:6,7-dimethyl-8-ribityllumazine synthase
LRKIIVNLDHSLRILIVDSRFYPHIANELLTGAKTALDEFSIAYDVLINYIPPNVPP